MDYAQQQRNPGKHLIGISFVIVFHVALVYALVNGLAHKIVEIVKKPYETKLIEEAKKPPPDKTPPPPPKLAPPPPAYIPPVEVNISVAAPAANTISSTTSARPVAAPPPVAAARHVERTAPVIDAARSCQQPEYPAAARRNEETGTVTLRFLIGVDGRVAESKIETSSGYPRLDEAARRALSLCQFKAGTVDGKPETSWARLQYVWKLE